MKKKYQKPTTLSCDIAMLQVLCGSGSGGVSSIGGIGGTGSAGGGR